MQWKNNTKDVYWSEIVDADTGLFSKSYMAAFAPELQSYSSLICNLAKQLYRECSEYTHGNFKVASSFLTQVEFDLSLLNTFIDKTKSLQYIIEFALFFRFRNELCCEDVNLLEPQISEYLGYLQEVNDYLATRQKKE